MKNIKLLILVLIPILFCVSCAKQDQPPSVSQEEIGDEKSHGIYTESDLGYYKVGYYYEVDLNNDGELEIVEVTEPYKFFTNIPDSIWGDDTGAVIRILNSNGKILYLKDLDRFQPVENVLVKDTDGDGFKEIVISIAETEEMKAKTYVYGWKDDVYKIISERVSPEPEKLTLKDALEFFSNTGKLHHEEHGNYYPGVDMMKLWQRVGIVPKPQTKDFNEYLFHHKIGKDQTCNLYYPKVELSSKVDLNILRITGSIPWDYQYLLFKKVDDEWVYFDHIDLFTQKYQEPGLAYWDEDNNVFSINALAQSGTGLYYYRERFYAIIEGKLKELLVISREGAVNGWGMVFDRKFEPRFNMEKFAKENILEIRYIVEVSANTYYYESEIDDIPDEFPLFTTEREVVLNWDGQKFKLNEELTDLTLEDTDNLYLGGYVEYYAMFGQEFDQLKQGDKKEQEWYDIFIKKHEEQMAERSQNEQTN